MKRLNYSILGSWLLCLCTLVATGQSLAPDIQPVTRTFAFTNATVVTAPDNTIEGATLVVKDGLIEAVGTDVEVPAGAKVIEADSMFIYAGFIDGFSHTGIPKPKPDTDRKRPDDPGNPTYEQAGIQPTTELMHHLKPDDKSVEEMRRLGFTAAQVAPYGRMLPGQTGLILLNGETAGDMLYLPRTGLFAQLEGARGVFPATVIGVMTKFRELYRQAEQAKAHETAYRKSPAGMKRPVQDPVLSALFPVLDGDLPVVFMAEDVKTLHRVLALQEDLDFPLVLAGLKEGWHLKDQLAAADIPVYLSLDLPEEKKKKKKEEEEEEMDPEMKMLEERRQEEMKNLLSQATELKAAGVEFGFSMAGVKAKDFKGNLMRLMENGLSEAEVLAALTTVPAKLMGLSAAMGSLEKGKIANLLVSDGPYFSEEAQVRYVLVDGHLQEFEAKKKKAKGEGGTPAKVSGQWSYSIEGTGQNMQGTLNLVDDGGAVSGTMSNPMTGQEGTVENVSLDGNRLTFQLPFDAGDGSMTVLFDLIIDGEYFEGTVDAGQYGTFPVEGSRIGDPD